MQFLNDFLVEATTSGNLSLNGEFGTEEISPCNADEEEDLSDYDGNGMSVVPQPSGTIETPSSVPNANKRRRTNLAEKVDEEIINFLKKTNRPTGRKGPLLHGTCKGVENVATISICICKIKDIPTHV